MIECRRILFPLLAVILTACVAEPRPEPQGQAAPPAEQPSRTLVIAIQNEPSTLALHPFASVSGPTYMIKRTFNAQLTYLDNEAAPHPYLAEALPQLNTPTWQVFPDGRMETTWKLKPGAVWHDGTPLTADDFLFTWTVYSTPELGHSQLAPFGALESVSAPDDRTIVFRWKEPFPGAATMYAHNREYPPLPRHLIETAFRQNTPEGFLSLPYWTREFVGLGPYRLDRWEPGQFLEASAFEQHAIGRPKISKVRLMFISDDNTVLANLLAGDIHLTADGAAQLSQVPLLKQRWVPSGAGAVHLHYNQYRTMYVQFRPEYLEQKALLDVRVRRALLHAVDRQAISDSVYGGEAPLGDFLLAPLTDLGRAADRAVVRYAYDPRRSEQIMTELGYARGSDGIFVSPTAGRLASHVQTNAGSDNEAEIAILADGWQRAGFAIEQRVLGGRAAREPETRATFPGLSLSATSATVSLVTDFGNTNIPAPENRWTGSNLGGWNHPQYTALAEEFSRTIGREQRLERIAPIARVFSDELPALSLSYRAVIFAHTSALTGLQNAPPDSAVPWNMHEWELR